MPKINEEKKVSDTEPQSPKTSFSCSKVVEKNEFILLPSAIVKFRCGNKTGRARILLDSCSQPTLAADTFVKRFRLPTFRTNSSIKGVAESSVGCSSGTRLTLWSRSNTFSIDIDAEIVPATCLSYSADTSFPYDVIEKLKELQLAEPCLADAEARIDQVDIVIGAKYYAKCILDGTAQINSLHLRRSHFGWLVSGVAPVRKVLAEKFCGFTLNEINDNLAKFWEIKNVESSSRSLSTEEEECVKHFESNYSFADDGKFIVRLPVKSDRREIANTRKRVEKALVRVENKLSSNLKSAYSAFMKEYELLGHMSLVKNSSEPAYYIPHREVIRESTSTTPLRVVFNASAKTFGKLSLNEALMTGPALQRDIFDILIGFRLKK